MIEGVPDLPSIPLISGFPKFIKSSGTTDVLRGISDQEIMISNPLMLAMGEVIFEHDFTWDAASNIYYIGLTQFTIPENLNRVATLIEVTIHNRSGANDDFSWYLWNANTGEVLKDVAATNINNKTWTSWHMAIGPDKIRDGDTVYAIVDEGVLGTFTNEPHFGIFRMSMTSLTDTKTFSEWLGAESLT